MTASPLLKTLSRRGAPLLAVCALTLLAFPAVAGAAFLEFESSFDTGGSPQGLATDAAGRVYVANTEAGKVDVYESASAGNRFIQSIGVGSLVAPVGVAVDNRSRIYVTDASRSTGVQYSSLFDGAKQQRTFGFPGSGSGQLGNPRQIDTDRAAQLFVAERDNARFQIFRIQGRDIVPGDAIGTTIGDVEGLTRDSRGRVIVSSDSAENGEVRALNEKGQPIGVIAGPGERKDPNEGTAEEDRNANPDDEDLEPAEPGKVNRPKQLAHDRLNRIVVADSLNDRVQAFGSLENGFGFLGAFGESGSGSGQLQNPHGVATAPGALLYVADTGNGRVVRLRMDDADGDGALDGGDNCPGAPNADQRDSDLDRVGDVCDPTPTAPTPTTPTPTPTTPTTP